MAAPGSVYNALRQSWQYIRTTTYGPAMAKVREAEAAALAQGHRYFDEDFYVAALNYFFS